MLPSDTKCATLYTDLILMHLGGAAKSWLEKIMDASNYELQSEYLRALAAKQARRLGVLEERAHAVLEVLRARGLEVTQETEDHVRGERDLDRLAELLRRAVTATDARELLR